MSASESPDLAVDYLRKLFDRHGVGERQRSALVGQVLGLAYHAAHRRATGTKPLSLEELRRMAAHFGESADDLFLHEKAAASVSASITVDGQEVPCTIWVGPRARSTKGGGLVARQVDSVWRVNWTHEVTGDEVDPPFEVSQILIRDSRRRIAVLDDHSEITEAVCEALDAAGFSAQGFHSVPELIDAATTLPFDAYILDWLVGDTSARNLVSTLREQTPGCPIAVLTGQVSTGQDVAQEIAQTVAEHDIDFYEKPVTMSIIIARLARKLHVETRSS